MSWYRAPLWDLLKDITSCRNVAVWNFRPWFCGTLSLTRGRVCNLQCNHSMARVAQNPQPYTVSSETPITWRTTFPYLHPPGRGWPRYTPEHWVPFTSPLTFRREFGNTRSRGQSYFKTDSQSVSQYVLVPSTLVGLATRYYFLSACCYLKFAVLFLWDALSDERIGQQFAV
jgi:hypothetical protein